MMRTQSALALSALMAFSGVGHGADLPSRAPPAIYVPPPPVFTWTGFYVGGMAGAVDGRSNFGTIVDPGTHLVLPANLSSVAASGTSRSRRTGFLAGGEAGYNYQIGSFVLGVEGDVEYIDQTRTASGSGLLIQPPAALFPFTITSKNRESLLATLRGRVGFSFDRLLLFATGGAAFTDRQVSQVYTDALAGPTTGSISRAGPTVGFAIGGGLEYALTNNWSLKGEYLFARFGRARGDYVITSQVGSTNVIHFSAGREDLQIGRIGLNYRFDTSPPVAARY